MTKTTGESSAEQHVWLDDDGENNRMRRVADLLRICLTDVDFNVMVLSIIS